MVTELFGGPAFAEAVLDAAPVIVLVLTERGRILDYNAFTERLCGRPAAEVRGLDWFDEFLIDDERESIRAFFENAITVRGKVSHIRARGGELRLIEWHDRKVHRDDGSIASVVAIGVDISDRVREANERTELGQRFDLFANRVDEAFFMTDVARTRVLYLSPAFDRITGVSRELIYADVAHLAALLHPDDRPSFMHSLGSAIPPEGKNQVEREYRILRAIPGREHARELRWLWVRYSEVSLREGEACRVVGTMTDITERKQSAQQVEELGRIFGLFNGCIDEVFLLLNPTRDRILYASESIEQMFGVERQAVYTDLGVLVEHIHPEDRGRMLAAIGQHVTSDLVDEFRVLTPDGSIRWIMSRLRTLGPESAMPGAIAAISMDITARHESEEALRRLTEELEVRVAERTRSLELERQRLQQIIDGMAVFVLILDPEGQILQVNARVRDSVANLPASFVGHPVDGVPGLRYSQQAIVDLHAALEQTQRGHSARYDFEVEDVDGHRSITDTTLSPIFDPEGRVRELVSSSIDVTDRRATERRLRESLAELEIKEARLADAQRIADVGDWDWDVVTNKLHWSDQAFRIFGLEVGSIEQTYDGFLAAVHEEDRPGVMAAVDHALRTGEHYEIEHRIVRPDAEVRSILENGEITRDEQGVPIRMKGTAQDVTRQKQVEAQLRASLGEKEALLHEIHHRVKNNLQVVTSLLYLKGVNASAEIREVLDECSARIRSMALIHEQLYVSGELARIEMHDFLAKLGEELARVFAGDRRIHIQVTGEGLQLGIERAVPVALIANELLTNALKYAYPNLAPSRAAEVRVRVQSGLLEIADDGIGLPVGLEGSTASSLGLRLVHSLARQLDARLEFSTPGTCIRLLLSD